MPFDRTAVEATTPPTENGELALQPGDVVMFRFPSAENQRKLEKTRPCLVLAIEDDEALIAYGTTRDNACSRPRELHVVLPACIAAAGLWRPTRFLGWRTVWAKLGDERFRPAPSGAPICGQLSRRSRRRLARLRAVAQADPVRPSPTGRRRRQPHFLGGAGR